MSEREDKTRWIYSVIDITTGCCYGEEPWPDDPPPPPRDEILDHMGANNWELVSVVGDLAYFKSRPYVSKPRENWAS